jgi:MFS family permease
MLTATLYSLGASAFVFLLPAFARQQLNASSVELGWLWSSLGIGMLVASVWLARINQGDLRLRLRLISAALTVGALAGGTLVAVQTPVLAAALICIFGGSTAMFTPIVWAMLQELTPEPLLGRVFTTFSTSAMAAAMAGMAGFGLATDAIGPAMSLVGIGVLLLGSAVVAALFSHQQPDKAAPELLAA